MSEFTISCLKRLLVPCFAAAGLGIGFNAQFLLEQACSGSLIYIEPTLNS